MRTVSVLLNQENKMCECKNISVRIVGSKVEDMNNLAPFVDEINTDFSKWETLFKCRDCKQLWLERYESHGHGNVPIVEKIAG